MASITTFFGTSGGGAIAGTLGQVAYFDGTDSVAGTDTFYWDDSGNPYRGLVIGGLAPSQGGAAGATSRLDIYGQNDLTSRVIAFYSGATFGNFNIMRLFESGTLALTSNIGTSGETSNVFIGDENIGINVTLSPTVSGSALRNVAIGHRLSIGNNPPGCDLTTGDDNVLIGTGAGRRVSSGSNSVIIGAGAGDALTTNGLNVLIGSNAGNKLTTSNTVYVGTNAGTNATSTAGNTGIGYNALFSMSTGGQNTALGSEAGSNVGITSENTFIGRDAGRYRGTGTATNTAPVQSIYLGASSRSVAGGGATNEIVIGYDAVGNGSNSVTLGHTTVTNTYLQGNINLVEGGNIVSGTTTGTKIGTDASQKLAFYNKTPIAQPTTSIASATIASGTGSAIKTDDTFDNYTIAQVVRALKNIGILA